MGWWRTIGLLGVGIATVGAAPGSSPPRIALVPDAIAFRDAQHGLLGTGWTACAANSGFGCRPQGTISATSDGGRSWHVVVRTPRPVIGVRLAKNVAWARLQNGKTLRSADGGRTWKSSGGPPPRPPLRAPCITGPVLNPDMQVSVTPRGQEWAVCTGEMGLGNELKTVYKASNGRWKRISWTAQLESSKGHGGLSTYGYVVGLSMADDGFGLIWESRGTLWVTRDGGADWTELPKIARPEIDFGQSGAALPGGTGFVVLARGGGEVRRLIETNDSGRTWHTVRRWR